MTTFCTAGNHASRGIYFYIVRIAVRTSAGIPFIIPTRTPQGFDIPTQCATILGFTRLLWIVPVRCWILRCQFEKKLASVLLIK